MYEHCQKKLAIADIPNMPNSLPFRFVCRRLRKLVEVNASLDAVGSVRTIGLGVAVVTDCFFYHGYSLNLTEFAVLSKIL